MKHTPLLLILSTVAVASGLAQGNKFGTDVFHYTATENLSPQAPEDATGKVTLSRKEQGKAAHQTLDISVKQLDTSASYLLFGCFSPQDPSEKTNWNYAGTLTTDAKGALKVSYRSQGQGQGKGAQSLPAALSPVNNLNALFITDLRTNAVLSANLTGPDKMQYLLKKDLSTGSVDALLRLKSTSQKGTFRLQATGLDPAHRYDLALNGTVVESADPDAKGRLSLDWALVNPLEVIGLRSITLSYWTTNIVLQSTLP